MHSPSGHVHRKSANPACPIDRLDHYLDIVPCIGRHYGVRFDFWAKQGLAPKSGRFLGQNRTFAQRGSERAQRHRRGSKTCLQVSLGVDVVTDRRGVPLFVPDISDMAMSSGQPYYRELQVRTWHASPRLPLATSAIGWTD